MNIEDIQFVTVSPEFLCATTSLQLYEKKEMTRVTSTRHPHFLYLNARV